jgi:alpha-tubulin suppressor-like RCC1 family protein
MEELRAIGLEPEEVKQRMAARQREYRQMLAMGCTRGAQFVPTKIPNIDHIRVKSVSAGYSHVMLLSDEGRLYGAGYNDRGQLGIG